MPDEGELIFANTIPNSKLRMVVIDYVQSRGPLMHGKESKYFRDWWEGIARGGELIQECAMAGGFRNDDPNAAPQAFWNRSLYYEVEEEGKKASATEWRKGEF